ncbi:hypothetical protein BVY04_04045 [bacterium M21]|nr:hypothetical protein BVY04_04045 [bacterium M21]
MAYNDRPNVRKKDLQDLIMLVDNYVGLLGGWDEAFEGHSVFLDDYDFEDALPRMLGHDMRQLLRDDVAQRVEEILKTNYESKECSLVWDLMPFIHDNQTDSFRLISGIYAGFSCLQ